MAEGYSAYEADVPACPAPSDELQAVPTHPRPGGSGRVQAKCVSPPTFRAAETQSCAVSASLNADPEGNPTGRARTRARSLRNLAGFSMAYQRFRQVQTASHLAETRSGTSSLLLPDGELDVAPGSAISAHHRPRWRTHPAPNVLTSLVCTAFAGLCPGSAEGMSQQPAKANASCVLDTGVTASSVAPRAPHPLYPQAASLSLDRTEQYKDRVSCAMRRTSSSQSTTSSPT